MGAQHRAMGGGWPVGCISFNIAPSWARLLVFLFSAVLSCELQCRCVIDQNVPRLEGSYVIIFTCPLFLARSPLAGTVRTVDLVGLEKEISVLLQRKRKLLQAPISAVGDDARVDADVLGPGSPRQPERDEELPVDDELCEDDGPQSSDAGAKFRKTNHYSRSAVRELQTPEDQVLRRIAERGHQERNVSFHAVTPSSFPPLGALAMASGFPSSFLAVRGGFKPANSNTPEVCRRAMCKHGRAEKNRMNRTSCGATEVCERCPRATTSDICSLFSPEQSEISLFTSNIVQRGRSTVTFVHSPVSRQRRRQLGGGKGGEEAGTGEGGEEGEEEPDEEGDNGGGFLQTGANVKVVRPHSFLAKLATKRILSRRGRKVALPEIHQQNGLQRSFLNGHVQWRNYQKVRMHDWTHSGTKVKEGSPTAGERTRVVGGSAPKSAAFLQMDDVDDDNEANHDPEEGGGGEPTKESTGVKSMKRGEIKQFSIGSNKMNPEPSLSDCSRTADGFTWIRIRIALQLRRTLSEPTSKKKTDEETGNNEEDYSSDEFSFLQLGANKRDIAGESGRSAVQRLDQQDDLPSHPNSSSSLKLTGRLPKSIHRFDGNVSSFFFFRKKQDDDGDYDSYDDDPDDKPRKRGIFGRMWDKMRGRGEEGDERQHENPTRGREEDGDDEDDPRSLSGRRKEEGAEGKRRPFYVNGVNSNPAVHISVTANSPAIHGCKGNAEYKGLLRRKRIVVLTLSAKVVQEEVVSGFSNFVQASVGFSLTCKSLFGCWYGDVFSSCATVTCTSSEALTAEEMKRKAAVEKVEQHEKAAEKASNPYLLSVAERQKIADAAAAAPKISETTPTPPIQASAPTSNPLPIDSHYQSYSAQLQQSSLPVSYRSIATFPYSYPSSAAPESSVVRVGVFHYLALIMSTLLVMSGIS